MDNAIERIRQANQTRLIQSQDEKRHTEQLESNKETQQVMFDVFRRISDMMSQGDFKIAQLVKALEELESTKLSKTELEVVKSGLSTLEKQIQEVPVDDLKKLPKFLERPDSVKVNNLKDLESLLGNIEKAIGDLDLKVEPPVVNVPKANVVVPAPVVNVPKQDLSPITKSLDAVAKEVKNNKPLKQVTTKQLGSLLDFDFDEYKLKYDEMLEDEDEPRLEATSYYLKGKKVATIKYTYDDDNKLIGGKKVTA